MSEELIDEKTCVKVAANSDWRVGSDHKLIYAETHGEVADLEEEEEEVRSGATWQGWKPPRGNADEVWAEMRELGEEDARAFIDEWIELTQDSEEWGQTAAFTMGTV